jgi:PiT family inorganic phosphate transporter
MRTLGRGIIDLDPARGFAAQTVGSVVLYVTAYVYAAPISTTHTITASVMGAGATKRFNAVRWGVAGNILLGWVLTIPMAALVGAGAYAVLSPLG